jgi:hypothetical protein
MAHVHEIGARRRLDLADDLEVTNRHRADGSRATQPIPAGTEWSRLALSGFAMLDGWRDARTATRMTRPTGATIPGPLRDCRRGT